MKQSPSDGSEAFKRRIVREGIAIEFTMELVSHRKRQPEKFREGDDVAFRFRIADTATGAPLANAYPAAWMDLRTNSQTVDDRICIKKAETFISGSLFAQAELDLNVYYVLTLNQDATITVVDPLFGFGGTKLLALVLLQSPGEDWALTEDQTRLFVSMPDSNQVAVVETASWNVLTNLNVNLHPTRLKLQPDNHYLWVAYGASGNDAIDSGVTVFTSTELEEVARIPTGRGSHEIAFSDDNRFAFVTNADAGTVSVIDIRTLGKIKDIKTGLKPTSIAFSPLAGMVYVAHEGDGTIVAIDGDNLDIVARMQTAPGLGQIKFAPGGRLGFVVHPAKDLIYILDASTNRIVQTGDLEDQPDQIAFSDEIAYVRHRGSETILMIPLDEVGVEGKPIPVADFPGGKNPPGKTSKPSPADSIVQAPGTNAVLVANPEDEAVYFYKEGMAAPMGNFSNYNRQPRAVLVVDRSLQERSSPGVYETTAKLRRPGLYDVVFFLDAPRIVHCFEVEVEANPEIEHKREPRPVHIQPLIENRVIRAGESVRLAFRLIDPSTKTPKIGLKDVNVLTFLAPGIWHKRHWAESVGEGVYAIDFVPPKSGIYYVYLACQSLGLTINNPQYLVLEATTGKTTNTVGTPSAPESAGR